MQSKKRSGKRHTHSDTHLLLLLIILVLLGAMLMTLSFRPHHIAWLAWVGLLPLLLTIKSFSPLHALLSGSIWGASIYAFSLFIPGTESHIPRSLYSLALLCIVPGAYAFGGSQLTRRIGFSPFILASAWFGVEFGLIPLGIPHGFLTHTQGELALARILESIMGFGFLGFLVVFAGAFVLEIAFSIHFHRPSLPLFSITQTSGVALQQKHSVGYFLNIIRKPEKPRAPPFLPA